DAEFHRLLKEGFEIEYLAKLVLGRHRRTASAQQMAEFQELFPDYIIKIYADRLKEYGDERFYVTGTSPAGKKDIYVHSEVTRQGRDPFAADWRVRFMNGQLRIIDIKIAGISMLQTQRDEFSARINNVGMDGLIEDLRIKTFGEAS
ncbi:MAG: ABC transporter substrate-binding protein, partial [Spirochaetales bacterium]|nr:ABC transporter substrate-binding protein [Spirochaetales bacterium]